MDSDIGALTTIFTEFYYWVTVVLMFLIHVGFCMYEVGVSRHKNHLHTLMKNTMLIPLVTVTFFFFGWWIYWAFPNGPWIYHGEGLILNADGWGGNDLALPWDPIMAVNFNDRIMMVFWAAFLLFSWTAASIVSGAVIERIRTSAFGLLGCRRFLGLALQRLDGQDAGLSRCVCVGRDPCCGRRFRSWHLSGAWPKDWQIRR